ncbi:hypothetical protein N7492_002296, partial [Penicillium capsulatum]
IDDASPGYASQNGGTTGGAGGTTTTLSSYAAFTSAVSGDKAKVVVVKGTITKTADQVRVGSNTSIIGTNSNAILENFGLLVKEASNVIIRSLGVRKVKTDNGNAIDILTVSNPFLHDHYKASLIGHSDNNKAEDTGHLHITQNNNYYYFLNVNDGINTRQGVQVLIESNAFVGSKEPLYSTDSGYAVANGNDFGDGSNSALAGTLKSAPYSYTLLCSVKVQSAVVGTAGQTLTF